MKGKETVIFSGVVIFLILTCSVQAAEAYRQLIDLGTLANDSSWAYSINDSGQIVGHCGCGRFIRKSLYLLFF